jgi:Bacterial regulatory proteins, luxR family
VAWERLAYPFEAAYACFRQAEALLAGGPLHTQAESVLRPAHQTAVALGAAPLRREIELLAKRGRLRLEQPVETPAAPTAPSSAAVSLGLTQRELEVLVLVAEGQTNRQIGQTCSLPQDGWRPRLEEPRQAGVTGRGEAAAVAHRLGLDKQ